MIHSEAGTSSAAGVPRRRRLRHSGWGAAAIAAAVTFIGISCWWLVRDRGVPYADAATHLYTAVIFHDGILEGHIGSLLHRWSFYPPATYLVGAGGMVIGGVNAWAPVVAQNLVYVPLLTLSCFGTARLLGGAQAGFLAVVFVLGSPLLIEQFHVFMLDAPETALVALAVWLILESGRFRRLGTSALAGVVVGLGVASKEQFPLFVAGLLAVTVLRGGGWRNWRGLLAFGGLAFAVGGPWYLVNVSHWQLITTAAQGWSLPARGRPPILSIENLGWYFWAIINNVLFAPLTLLAAAGCGRAVALMARGRPVARDGRREDLLPELLVGLAVGWLGISLTPHHDLRYAMPLLVYLAVFGTWWIPVLPRLRRRAGTAALVAAAAAATIGMSFGVGPDVRVFLGRHVVTDIGFGVPAPDAITVHAHEDFAVAAPRRGDDVPGLFAALRRDGVTGVAWQGAQAPVREPVLDAQGLALEARFAGLTTPDPTGAKVAERDPPARFPLPADGRRWLRAWWNVADPNHVFMTRGGVGDGPPPGIRLRDGTGLWLDRGGAPGIGGESYCPRSGRRAL